LIVTAVVLTGLAAWRPSTTLTQQAADTSPTVVKSGDERLWDQVVGVTVVVRDVDQPTKPIDEVALILQSLHAPAGNPLHSTSRSDGTTSLVAPDSGTYRLTVLRVGYDRLQVLLHLEPACRQTVEVYIAQAVKTGDDPVYTVGQEPKRRPATPRTSGRAVLTTCVPAA
jgi:hypothetical protein